VLLGTSFTTSWDKPENFLVFSKLDPKTVLIDGVPRQSNDPIAIESGKTKTLSATYESKDDPRQSNDFDTQAICPFIFSFDIKNNAAVAVCRGEAVGLGLGPNLSTLFGWNINDKKQSRILPHHAESPTCPVVR
jgi:hypothetical protein